MVKELKGKQALATSALTLATSYELIVHNSTTFIPADYETGAVKPTPVPERKIWLPMTRKMKKKLGNGDSNILFYNDAEMSNFDYMLQQYADEDESQPDSIFIRTEEGLRVLTEDGQLIESDGTFRPNMVKPQLNTTEVDKKEVFSTISEWLQSDDEAHSLLNHLATALAPGWSAVKYVLLVGDGRNGKSLLLLMMRDLFGSENVSNVTRQQMSESLQVCTELNNKLLNIVFDGRMDYVKDSSMEKTLIAGEPGYVRLLYENGTTMVQTNGLFIEGLNKEPKTRDKSSALQKRLVRFNFPNVYELDKKFEAHMRSPQMLGAFLSLLIDHYVKPDEVHEKLALSAGAQEMQTNQMWANSPILQFITQHLLPAMPDWPTTTVGAELDPLISSFMAWRISEGYSEYSSADVQAMCKDVFTLDWKTKRVNGQPSGNVRRIRGLKPETLLLIEQHMREVEDDKSDDTVVDE